MNPILQQKEQEEQKQVEEEEEKFQSERSHFKILNQDNNLFIFDSSLKLNCPNYITNTNRFKCQRKSGLLSSEKNIIDESKESYVNKDSESLSLQSSDESEMNQVSPTEVIN